MTTASRKTRSSQPTNFIASASVVPATMSSASLAMSPMTSRPAQSLLMLRMALLLSPETARVAAIGYLNAVQQRCIICYDPDEPAMLRQFWKVFSTQQSRGLKLIGFNSAAFGSSFHH